MDTFLFFGLFPWLHVQFKGYCVDEISACTLLMEGSSAVSAKKWVCLVGVGYFLKHVVCIITVGVPSTIHLLAGIVDL